MQKCILTVAPEDDLGMREGEGGEYIGLGRWIIGRWAELAIFGKTPMKLPLAKRSFDLDLDIWLGNRKEPNSQMHVQWFH